MSGKGKKGEEEPLLGRNGSLNADPGVGGRDGGGGKGGARNGEGPKSEVLEEYTKARDAGVGATVVDLLSLAIPIFVAMVSWAVMKGTDTALLGHVGTQYLSGSAVSDLYTSSSRVFLNAHVLSVFAGNAIGSNNPKMVGVWVQVSLVVLVRSP